jgi:membrane-associated PAP2 superfamily phosphatase
MRAKGLVEYYGNDDGRQFLLRQAVILAVTALALCAAFGDGRIDLAIARWFFDDARHVFPFTNQWLFKTVLHDAARTASAVGALTLLGLTVTSWVTARPRRLHARRQSLLLASGACFAAAAAVGLLKHFSAHACPWDLAIFGGAATYQPLFGATAAAHAVNGCSPAAHPLVGYAWLGCGFALLPTARRTAWGVWAVAFFLGTLFGVVQILRGAHFLSHVLWSAWFVWGFDVALVAACVYLPVRLRAIPQLSRPAASDPPAAPEPAP